jgi:DnaD/phage-associated family protein
MDDFHGFPPGELRTTPIPDMFFSHVLPAITDAAELKVTLHVFWRCHRHKGRLRSVSHDELLNDVTLRRALLAEDDWQVAVERGLDAAVERGTLLRFQIGDQLHYAPNTAVNRAAITSPARSLPRPARPARPLPPPASASSPATLLYEQYIGLVTPIIAAELAEAEREYPMSWLADAFAEAAARDKRNWRYVQAILRGWASEGKR